MAGEWIAYDLTLPAKPEVQELIDTTGEPVEVVVFRLLQLWGWASMHCADGTARMTLGRLARTCGGDEAFWRAVAAVGWLEIDEEAATVAVPGWDRRFSQAAKARLQHRDRAAVQEEKRGRLRSSAGTPCADAQVPPALERRRGEERREENPPPPPACAEGDAAAGWVILRTAWNRGAGVPWKPLEAPAEALERLSEPGWLDAALTAIGRLPGCKYFQTPVSLTQFCHPKFVRKVNLGQYDDVNPDRRRRPAGDERPPPRVDPAFAAAVKATQAREAARLEAMKREAGGDDDLERAKTLALRQLSGIVK